MHALLGLYLIIGNFILYIINRRVFLLSIFVVYPIVAQMVSLDVTLMNVKINLSMLYGSLLFATCSFEFLRQLLRYGIFRDKGLPLFAVLFMLSCFTSMLFSSDKVETFYTSIKISTWILLIFFSRDTFRKFEDITSIGRQALLASGIISISYVASKLGFYGSQGGYKYYDYKIDVAVGHFYNSVAMAYPLTVCIPALLICVFIDERKKRKKHKKRKMWILAILGNLLIIMFTYVRTPLIAIGFAFIIFAYYVSRYGIRRLSKTLILGGGAFVLAFWLFQYLDPGNATRRWTELEEQAEAGQYKKLGSGRLGLAMNALNFQMQEQTAIGHLFGIGVGNTGSISRSGKIVHNGYLEIWLGCGIIGLIFYFMFIISVWANIRQIIKLGENKQLKMAGALAVMNFSVFLVGSFDVIITAVFPMSILAIHLGATLGVAQPQEVTQENKLYQEDYIL